MGRILLTGLAVQIAGLLLLCATFSLRRRHQRPDAGPATALIGWPALIVNSFYRIGMRVSAPATPGPGAQSSAPCSRRPSVSDRLFLVRCSALARRGGGNYPQALIDFLLVEVAMMLLLGR